MESRHGLVTVIHVLLASTVAIVGVIGLFGGRADGSGPGLAIGFQLSLFLVVPMIGAVAFGLAEWQLGRGPGVMRAADLAAFLLGALLLSLGETGLARWLAGAIALLAAGGIAASLVVVPPRRGGFRF
jgi:hypothetical protein